MRKLHLADISKYVGYSKTLCSMVLNGKGNKYGISKKTQEEVLEAARKLCYTPNKYAQSLRTGKSYFIGLIVSDVSNPFYAALVKSIERTIAETDYSLMVCTSNESEDRERLLVEMMLSQQGVDGLIIASTYSNASFYDQQRFANAAIVFVDRVVPLHRANYVVIDNFGGALEIVNQLFKEGMKRIACLSITPSHLSTVEDRLNGYRTALRNNGIHDTYDLVRSVRHDHVEEDVARHLQEFLLASEKLDAVFAMNNQIAVALLKILRQPKYIRYSRIKIGSFDDVEIFDLVNRKVISISQPVAEIGQRSAELMLDLLSGKKINKSYQVLTPKLIER